MKLLIQTLILATLVISCDLINKSEEKFPFSNHLVFHFVDANGNPIIGNSEHSYLKDEVRIIRSDIDWDFMDVIGSYSYFCVPREDSLNLFAINEKDMPKIGSRYAFPRDTIFVQFREEDPEMIIFGFEEGSKNGEKFYFQKFMYHGEIYTEDIETDLCGISLKRIF